MLTASSCDNSIEEEKEPRNHITFPVPRFASDGKWVLRFPNFVKDMVHQVELVTGNMTVNRWTLEALLCVKHIPLLREFANVPDYCSHHELYLPVGQLRWDLSQYQNSQINIALKHDWQPSEPIKKEQVQPYLGIMPDELIGMVTQYVDFVGPNVKSQYSTKNASGANMIQCPLLQCQSQGAMLGLDDSKTEFDIQLFFNHPVFMINIVPEFSAGNGTYGKFPDDHCLESIDVRMNNHSRQSYQKGEHYLRQPGCISEKMLIYTLPFARGLFSYTESGAQVHEQVRATLNFSRVDQVVIRVRLRDGEGIRRPIRLHFIAWNYNVMRFNAGMAGVAYA